MSFSFIQGVAQNAMRSAYQALNASQSDVANARARGSSGAPAPAPSYQPGPATDPNILAWMQQQAAQTAYFLQSMAAQQQAMMNMVMMFMMGGGQNQAANQNPLFWLTQFTNGNIPMDMFISQAQLNQLPSDQQDEVQQVVLSLLAKLQIAMSQIGAYTGQGNQNTTYNTELGLIRADLTEDAQAALINVRNEVAKVSMSSANINSAVSAALEAGANPNDLYQVIRNGYNKDDQLPLSRFYALMAQPTRTSDLSLQSIYKALSDKAASAEVSADDNGLFV